MKSFKVVYRGADGKPRASVVSYTEDLANDRADEMEDEGVEILDIVECKLGTPPEDIEKLYEGR
ncbi:hypothetical protein SEA_YARA_55 [Streptomyces phage Yara]|nr:hypothetical protein SEA_YARA_55 [Streptomyces phage Yara]